MPGSLCQSSSCSLLQQLISELNGEWKRKQVCLHSSSNADLPDSMNNSLWLHTPRNNCPVLKVEFVHCINGCFGSNSIYVVVFFCAKVITSHLLYLFNSFAFACFYLIRIPVHNPYHHKNKAKKRSYPRVLSLFSSSRHFSLKKKKVLMFHQGTELTGSIHHLWSMLQVKK